MGLINRNTASSHLYGGATYAAPTVSESGDVEVQIREQVAIGATVVFEAAFQVAEMTAMSAWTDNPDAIITDGVDTFLAAGIHERLWTASSGEANPLTGPAVTGITVDNSAGTVAANVTVHVLIENP